MDNFQQTVDLRDQMEKRRRPASPADRPSPLKKIVTPIEKIYQDEEPDKPKADLQKISRPEALRPESGLFKLIVFILAMAVVSATVYSLFFRQKSAGLEPLARGWYAVKLVDGEIFYGQIADLKDDPVVIANVYYNYDQAKGASAVKGQAKPSEETGLSAQAGNIRLVKRGKETHGPDGSMNVVRAQVLFMEPLKADSKVLKAILEYEKQ